EMTISLCGRNQLMVISPPQSIPQVISRARLQILPQAAAPQPNVQSDTDYHLGLDELCCIAHPYGNRQSLGELANRHAGQARAARMAVGPEGGFSDAEIEQWSQAGWLATDLGPRILRIEMAALQLAAWWASL